MATYIHHLALVHDDNPISQPNRPKPVGYYYGGLIRCYFGKALVYPLFF